MFQHMILYFSVKYNFKLDRGNSVDVYLCNFKSITTWARVIVGLGFLVIFHVLYFNFIVINGHFKAKSQITRFSYSGNPLFQIFAKPIASIFFRNESDRRGQTQSYSPEYIYAFCNEQSIK